MKHEILKKLMFNPGISFNELWGNDGESNAFAYHLKSLVDEGYVDKKNQTYALSDKGKKEIMYIDGFSGEKEETPLPVVAIVLENDGRFLIQKRTKEPFYGYHAFPSGKIKKGETVEKAALRELYEETGLKADLKLIGIFNVFTQKSNDVSHHHIIHVFYGKNPKGSLSVNNKEGSLEWYGEDFSKLKPSYSYMPSVYSLLKSPSFGMFDVYEKVENDNLVLCDVKKTQ